jgi:hypothetical protein
MIETDTAVKNAASFTRYPLARVYVGLNDLHIDRGSQHIFSAVADGTVERVKREIGHVPFGFGGLTLPEMGEPLPCLLLVAELARLECQFSFLRRSFYRDIEGRALSSEIPRMLAAMHAAVRRSPIEVDRDYEELLRAIGELPNPPWRALEDVTFP